MKFSKLLNGPLFFFCLFIMIFVFQTAFSQVYLLSADRVFDGMEMHDGWSVLVDKEQIKQTGPIDKIDLPSSYETIDLTGMTLLPGLIEGHSHIMLHPYNEATWNDQVLRESRALRTARATVHVYNTLIAGFTTMRDLGTEGAGFADVGIKEAIEKGTIPGPRLLVAGRAIVATGAYGPKGFDPGFEVPLGAEAADGPDLIRVVRDQIGKGVDIIKVYADYTWGPSGEKKPTFSQAELESIVKTAASCGVPVSAHAETEEGMRRAILAGVVTIEHGLFGGTPEIYKLMADKGVALFPTLSATEAIMEYKGWDKSSGKIPPVIKIQHEHFEEALIAGVNICNGSDVGVFTHGDNAREPELMVEYGMKPLDVLKAATSRCARVFRLNDKIGKIKQNMLADIIAVKGNPIKDIKSLQEVSFVMKNGTVYKKP